jgi:spermidine synthase
LYIYCNTFQINLSIVDIDEAMVTIATDWFGFVKDDLMTVHVCDGLELVQKEVDKGQFSGEDI